MVKTEIFSLERFRQNIFKIITLVPGVFILHLRAQYLHGPLGEVRPDATKICNPLEHLNFLNESQSSQRLDFLQRRPASCC
jgi:hypothetical protein